MIDSRELIWAATHCWTFTSLSVPDRFASITSWDSSYYNFHNDEWLRYQPLLPRMNRRTKGYQSSWMKPFVNVKSFNIFWPSGAFSWSRLLSANSWSSHCSTVPCPSTNTHIVSYLFCIGNDSVESIPSGECFPFHVSRYLDTLGRISLRDSLLPSLLHLKWWSRAFTNIHEHMWK